jgi:D-inositol-3-phosphate glycosyltransferase
MNIIIAGTAYPYRGGLAAYNERLARQFVSEGHDVKIFTFLLQYPGFLFPGKSQFLDSAPPAGLSIERKINSINPFNWILVGYKIKKLRPDILIFKYWLPFMAPCFGTIARIAKSNHHTKVLCIFDNVIPHEKRPGDRLLTKYYVNAVDGAVVMSRSVLIDLGIFRKDIPARLNPHPLFDNFGPLLTREEALKKLELPERGNYLLFFGFIRSYKGLDLLIKALAEPMLRAKNLKLIIAGEFYGSATQSGVTQIAYHFEKPMLVTDVGGLREIVPDKKCGYVVNPDPGEIADAISDFFENDRKEEFTVNVKKEKARYDWSKMTASVNEVYSNCLSDDNKK